MGTSSRINIHLKEMGYISLKLDKGIFASKTELVTKALNENPQHRKDIELLKEATKMGASRLTKIEHLSCTESLRELGLFSMEKRKLCGSLIASCQ